VLLNALTSSLDGFVVCSQSPSIGDDAFCAAHTVGTGKTNKVETGREGKSKRRPAKRKREDAQKGPD